MRDVHTVLVDALDAHFFKADNVIVIIRRRRNLDIERVAQADAPPEQVSRRASCEARAYTEVAARAADLGMLEVGVVAALLLAAADVLASLLREDLLGE